jgi:hypothetical protein
MRKKLLANNIYSSKQEQERGHVASKPKSKQAQSKQAQSKSCNNPRLSGRGRHVVSECAAGEVSKVCLKLTPSPALTRALYLPPRILEHD